LTKARAVIFHFDARQGLPDIDLPHMAGGSVTGGTGGIGAAASQLFRTSAPDESNNRVPPHEGSWWTQWDTVPGIAFFSEMVATKP